ncbi:hypothetical protein HN51_005116, partial [Arachis hypogaea]
CIPFLFQSLKLRVPLSATLRALPSSCHCLLPLIAIAFRLSHLQIHSFQRSDVTSSAVTAVAARVARALSDALIAFAPFVAIVVRALSAVLLSYEILPRRSRHCFFSPRRRFVIVSFRHRWFREGYEPVQIQRKKRILKQRLKVPPALNQFTKTLDKNLDLAVLVHEQGAMIDDIGSNIEQSHAATAQARSQLAKASKTQRSNSSLVIYIGSEISFSVGSCLLPHPDKLILQWLTGIFVLIYGFVERKQFSADISSKLGSSFSIVPFVIMVSVCTILTMIATLPVAQLFFFHILLVEKQCVLLHYVPAWFVVHTTTPPRLFVEQCGFFVLLEFQQLGCGSASIDLLATVAAYPKPDEKIRSTSFKVEGGGNAANALTCAARLGLKPRLISKVADDTHGRAIIDELQADGVDMSFIVVSEEGTSPFTYIIVDSQTRKIRALIRKIKVNKSKQSGAIIGLSGILSEQVQNFYKDIHYS